MPCNSSALEYNQLHLNATSQARVPCNSSAPERERLRLGKCPDTDAETETGLTGGAG